MNIKKRTLPAMTGSAPKNAVSQRRDAITQAGPIRNAVSKPKATGYHKLKGAVSG